MDKLEWFKYRSCERKEKYSLARANVIIDYHASKKEIRYFYLCRFCSYYHVTKKEPFKYRTRNN